MNLKFISLTFIFSIVSLNTNADINRYSRNFTINPEFFSAQINTITMLPVIDTRKNKQIDSKLGSDILLNYMLMARGSGNLIAIKDYTVTNLLSYHKHQSSSINQLKNPEKEWVKALGSNNSNHILIIVVSDAYLENTFGYSANFDIHGYLYDKNLGVLVWSNFYKAHSGQGGLLGMVSTDYTNISTVVSSAIRGLFKGFPKRNITQNIFNKTWAVEDIEPVDIDDEF